MEVEWDDFNPMKDEYTSVEINSYNKGPGSNIPIRRLHCDQPRVEEENLRLYFAKVPLNLNESGLRNFISNSGLKPVRIRLLRHKSSQGNHDPNFGFAFVDFETVKEATEAIHTLSNKPPYNFKITFVSKLSDQKYKEELIKKEQNSRSRSQKEPLIKFDTSENIDIQIGKMDKLMHLMNSGKLFSMLKNHDSACVTCMETPHIEHLHFVQSGNYIINPKEVKQIPNLINIICKTCSKKSEDLKMCSCCEKVFYCSKQCQEINYEDHKAKTDEKGMLNFPTEKQLEKLSLGNAAPVTKNGFPIEEHHRIVRPIENGGDVLDGTPKKIISLKKSMTITKNIKDDMKPISKADLEEIPKPMVSTKSNGSGMVKKMESSVINKKELITISFGISPTDFFAQKLSDTETSTTITTQLNDICNKCEFWEDVNALEKGDYCAGLFDQDGFWYRAQVAEKRSNGFVIKFIDFGNIEVVDATKLQPLPKSLIKYPALAIWCSLDVVPITGSEWSGEAIQAFSTLNHDFTRCLVKRQQGNIYIVDLFNEKGSSLTDLLINEQLAKGELSTPKVKEAKPENLITPKATTHNMVPTQVKKNGIASPKTSEIQSSPTVFSLRKKLSIRNTSPKKIEKSFPSYIESFKSRQNVDGIITKVHDKNKYQVCIMFELEKFIDLSENINNIYDNGGKIPESINKGDIVAIKASDGEWYRACILSDLGKGKGYFAAFLDTGYVEEVTEVKALKSEFLSIPSYISLAVFEDNPYSNRVISSLNDSNPESISLSIQSVEDGNIKALGCVEELKKFRVNLHTFDWFLKNCIDINTVLHSPSPEAPIEVENHTIIQDSSPKSNSQVKVESPLTANKVIQPTAEPVVRKTIDDILSELPYNKLESGNRYIVLFQDDEKPSTFYVIANNDDVSRAIENTYKLSESGEKVKPSFGLVAIGKCCSDQEWYRCIVSEVGDTKSKVYFVDYGNFDYVINDEFIGISSDLELSSLKPIASKCQLFRDPDGSPSEVAKMHKKIAKYLNSGTPLKINVYSFNNGCHNVTV